MPTDYIISPAPNCFFHYGFLQCSLFEGKLFQSFFQYKISISKQIWPFGEKRKLWKGEDWKSRRGFVHKHVPYGRLSRRRRSSLYGSRCRRNCSSPSSLVEYRRQPSSVMFSLRFFSAEQSRIGKGILLGR